MAKADLFEAIRKNSLRQMSLLLESGGDADCRNDNSETPLMVALYRLRNKEQREKAIKMILQAGADVNARNGQGRTALAYACALDQADSIRQLLQKKDIDVNQGDVSGVTPLMLATALGHRSAVSTLMEFERAGGHVRLNPQAKDDSDFTALDYASASGNAGLADQIRGGGGTRTTPGKGGAVVTSKPAAGGGGAGGGNRLNNNVNLANRNNMNNVNNSRNFGGPNNNTVNKGNRPPQKAGEEIEMAEITPAALRDSNLSTIQAFGREVKALQAETDTNLAAVSASRPSSRATTDTPRSRTQSMERVGSRADSRATQASRSQERPGSTRTGAGRGGSRMERPGSRMSKVSSRGSHSTAGGGEDDEDLDLDLSSLRELMGTVREAAKEIREIVEPMQREKENAARVPREGKSRRTSHGRKGGHGHGHGKTNRNSGHHQEIQAEVHVISEINGRAIPPLPPATPLPPSGIASSSEQQQHQQHLPPSAFLHVENEELSQTWPRQKGRSVSRERSLSGGQTIGAVGGGGGCSEGSSPIPIPKNNFGGPPTASHAFPPGDPHSKVSPTAAKTEREILDKVVGRQYGGPDPLVAAINRINTTPKSRLIMESRQRIVGMARDHWSTHQPYPYAAAAGGPQPSSPSPSSTPPSQPSSPQPLPHITVSEHAAFHAEPYHREKQEGSTRPVQPAGGEKGPSAPASPSDETPPPLSPFARQQQQQQHPAGPPAPSPASQPPNSPHPSPRAPPNARQAPNAGQQQQPPQPAANSGSSPTKQGPNTGRGPNSGPAARPGPNTGPARRPGPNQGQAPKPGPNPAAGSSNKLQGSPTKPAVGQSGPNAKPAGTGPNMRPTAQTGMGPGNKQNSTRPAANGGPPKAGLRRAAP